MAVKAAELRSGIFVVLALLVLSVLLFSVGNFGDRLRSATRYVTYVSDAKFLKTHDAVTYSGLRIGEIKALEVSTERHGMVKITVAVDATIPVHEDASLTVKQDGIMGAKYLELSPGTVTAKPAAAGATLPGIVPVSFVELGPSFEGPLSRLDKLLDNLNQILGDGEFRKNLTGVLTESRAALAALTEQIQKVGAAAGKAGDKTTELLAEVQETVKAAREPLTKTLKHADALTLSLAKDADQLTERVVRMLDDVTTKLAKSADSLDQLLRDTDGIIVQNNKNLYETLRGLRDTTAHLERAAKRIRANPSVVLFGPSETPEEFRRNDETELRLKGRARRYDKEDPK